MPETAIAHLRYNADHLLSEESTNHADESVVEVFGMMLGLTAVPVAAGAAMPPSDRAGDITVIVGFSGAMQGNCEIRMAPSAARAITFAMLGEAAAEEQDGAMDDAVGEICNMLAGGWKRRIPELHSDCSLSPPTVISGTEYKVHTRMQCLQMTRTYQFDKSLMQLTLRCLEIG